MLKRRGNRKSSGTSMHLVEAARVDLFNQICYSLITKLFKETLFGLKAWNLLVHIVHSQVGVASGRCVATVPESRVLWYINYWSDFLGSAFYKWNPYRSHKGGIRLIYFLFLFWFICLRHVTRLLLSPCCLTFCFPIAVWPALSLTSGNLQETPRCSEYVACVQVVE